MAVTVSDLVFSSENRMRWNEVAEKHARSGLYRVPEVISGTAMISSLEREALGDASGAACLHLMCHIATDSIILGRNAACVVGLDYSPSAISIAQRLVALTRAANMRFLVGDVHAIPLENGQFDIVFLNWGSLVWIFDLDAVLAEIRRVLRPGGRVVIVDQHPVSLSYRRGWEGRPALIPVEDYFGPRQIRVERRDYADRTESLTHPTVLEARHTLAEVLNRVITHFTLVRFTEHPFLGWPAYRGMSQEEPTLWTLPESPVPLSFVIVASAGNQTSTSGGRELGHRP